MRPRAAIGMTAVILSSLSWGCRGEFTYDLGDATSGEADNLLANPSFELWNGEQPEVWDVGGATLTRVDEGVDGDFSGIVTAVSYASVRQALSFPQALPVGTCLRGGASIRWISGAAMAPAFLVTAIAEDNSEELLGDGLPWTADGQWHDAQIPQVELPLAATTLIVSIGNSTADSHSYGLDAAWLQLEPCE